MDHSRSRCVTAVLEYQRPIWPSFFRNFSRLTTRSRKRKGELDLGWRSRNGSSSCTAEKSGWIRKLVVARHSPSRCQPKSRKWLPCHEAHSGGGGPRG